jgi:alpha-amylase/alpha-mannosidase (GH57 family)
LVHIDNLDLQPNSKSPLKTAPPLYLNLIWHQHQPLYADPQKDQLQAPWVRTHATKDYYAMPELLSRYPDVHCTVNLTPVLLSQIQNYYVARLEPFVDLRGRRFQKDAFLRKFKGKTDLWIDLMLKDTRHFDKDDRTHLLGGLWNAWSISDVILYRFPDYQYLKAKSSKDPFSLSVNDMRRIKFLFFLVNFDPSFLEKRIRLRDGSSIGVSKFVERREKGTYHLVKKITERDCEEIVVDTFLILKNVVSIHKSLMYKGKAHQTRRSNFTGQIELSTTPFFHPILPLIYDSDVAETCQPLSELPARFHSPDDAELQVRSGLEYFRSLFGVSPQGLWPSEGSVSQSILPLLSRHGIRWIASDEKILALSEPRGLFKYSPHVVGRRAQIGSDVALFFRDTELSDKVGFLYKEYEPNAAAEDFIQTLLKHSSTAGGKDRLVTVILDGENAWEWYRHDAEGRTFLRTLYERLALLYQERRVITVTPTEYLEGNPKRGVPPHPLKSLPRIRKLWPGSWINANYDTWIGSQQKNLGWEILRATREALLKSGIRKPNSFLKAPATGTKVWFAHKSWEELLAAEGSDWFWWMGSEQSDGDKPGSMSYLFVQHLRSCYECANHAGANLIIPDFESLLNRGEKPGSTIGTMRKSDSSPVTVRFQCDARRVKVPEAIYIVGNHPSLGGWVPNKVRMYDDGTHGDRRGGDGIWTIELTFPLGCEVLYKFTNSGVTGRWHPGEELPALNRKVEIPLGARSPVVLLDLFGKL